MTTRARKFVEEALILIGEAEDNLIIDDTVDTTNDSTEEEENELDLETVPDEEEDVEDEFDLGGVAPVVRIEKEGPITINKGDVELTIGDDGNIDITLNGEEPPAVPVEDEDTDDAEDIEDIEDTDDADKSKEDDEYKIEWEKEEETETEESLGSKATQVLEMHKVVNVPECIDNKYECMSCDVYEECKDKYKKAVPKEEKDFLTQGYK